MKNTLLLLFSICCLCLNAQVSQQLVKVHNVANLTALNNILLPLAGQMVFVNDIKLTYQYDGTIWKAFSSSTPSTSNQIIDLDSDTKLSVDNGSDNDIIQFNDGSINFKMEGPLFRVDNSLSINPVLIGETGTGVKGSILLGHDAHSEYNINDERSIGIGFEAMKYAENSDYNVAIGAYSMRGPSTDPNTGVDHEPIYNTAVGYKTLINCYRCQYNIAFGAEAMPINNSSVVYNSAIGSFALFSNTGDYNLGVGYKALYNNISGDYNIAIGRDALKTITTSSYNIAIGFDAQVPVASDDAQVRIGNDSITYAFVQVAWSITSDLHWKDSVQSLAYGLDLIKELRPVSYLRKGAFERKREIGFIAQELELALRKVGYHDQGFLTKTDKGLFEVRYNDFIGITINAIKEQQLALESYEIEFDSHETEMEETKKRLLALQNKIDQLK